MSVSISRHSDFIAGIFQLLEQFLACFGASPSTSLLNSSRAHGGNSQGGPGTIPSWQFGCVSLFWRLGKLHIMEIVYSMPAGISIRERSWRTITASAWQISLSWICRRIIAKQGRKRTEKIITLGPSSVTEALFVI